MCVEQFKHLEGIRGIFAVSLTSSESLLEEDDNDVPRVLREAVVAADPEIMVPLACTSMVLCFICISLVNRIPSLPVTPFFIGIRHLMAGINVVMPTAMISLHTHPDLKECTAKTATTGKKILRLLRGNRLLMDNC
eukprot:CCRYP_013276-RA/>CCRYP_013276-RA protein AED:0.11 eAED:0.13 QI:0/-1/0/1/-1/1/1/0/135